jgi:hypothetical protein
MQRNVFTTSRYTQRLSSAQQKDAHAKAFTIQRRCVLKHHALLLVDFPVVWQIAGLTIVVCVQGPSRCQQTTRTTLTRWGSTSIIQPRLNPIFRHVENQTDSAFGTCAHHLDQACQTPPPCHVLVLFLCLRHGLHGRKPRRRRVGLQQLHCNWAVSLQRKKGGMAIKTVHDCRE